MKKYWVKKTITQKEWYNNYSNRLGYGFLEKRGSDVDIGFLTVGNIPSGCELLSDEEMRVLHLQRKAKNELPLPLKEEKKRDDSYDEDQAKIEEKLEEMRNYLKEKQIIR